jgi:mono/diheme cytochrome c family protein
MLLLSSAASAADLPGDPVAGHELAHTVCAICHFVAEDQPEDPEIGPSFYEIAAHSSVTTLSLRVYLQTPHSTMPNLMLTPEETDDVISYILSLKEP